MFRQTENIWRKSRVYYTHAAAELQETKFILTGFPQEAIRIAHCFYIFMENIRVRLIFRAERGKINMLLLSLRGVRLFMKFMTERVAREGRALNEDVLLVDCFLNHQVDMDLMRQCG